MTEPLWLWVAKAVSSPLLKLAGYVANSLRRPSLSYRRAPANLFQHVKPGVSVQRMRELLGSPHKERTGEYCYTFADACVQVNASDDATIDAVSVAISDVGWRNQFPIWPMTTLTLGKTSFKEVVEENDGIHAESSSKFFHFYVVRFYGFPGLYWNYA